MVTGTSTGFGKLVTEVKASHAVFISQPEAVAQVIESAAQGALTAKKQVQSTLQTLERM